MCLPSCQSALASADESRRSNAGIEPQYALESSHQRGSRYRPGSHRPIAFRARAERQRERSAGR